MKVTVVVFLISVFLYSEAKRFARCELVAELTKQGFPEVQMRDWVCLIESESLRTTAIISKPNKNGSQDYGLFQINDKFWCSNTSSPGKGCNVTCRELLDEDITKASTCAKKIYERQSFTAWHGWVKRCQGSLPDISSC